MRAAICIGCGCEEDHGCALSGAGAPVGCWWIRFDADERTGVCSGCWDLARVWDAARDHRPILPLIAERYYRQLLFLYGDQASALAWMNAPHQLLGGKSARDVILAGGLDRVRAVVDMMRSGAFA